MRRPDWFRSVRGATPERPALASSVRRDRIAALLALVTGVCLVTVFMLSKGTAFLMPGPLASAHGAIENCSSCHTKSGSGKVSWVHGLAAGDPRADSKACIICHKMPDTAFNAHSASAEVLKQSTERLSKTAAGMHVPQSARVQNTAFPAHKIAERGIYCATCHQEHQGTNFKLNKISNEQCRSCHVVKFDSFDGDHPKFENYPFKRRTRIVYDHAAHFSKHYPEVAKKDPAKRIPDTCSTCHQSSGDKRVMAVAPFEKTCASCHLNQIKGNERASGPKGIAFLALPGLDLQSLKSKNAAIGEWPDDSEAVLTPFMKLMISRNAEGRALITTIDGLNLQDLGQASDDQITAVKDLVWEIKKLFHALISGKASDALGDLNISGGAKLSASLVADLTAGIPRDVVVRAQQQWLPNLAAEIANGPGSIDPAQQDQSASDTKPEVASKASSEQAAVPETEQEIPEPAEGVAEGEAAPKVKRDPPACAMRLFGQCLLFQGGQDSAGGDRTAGADAKSKTENGKSGDGKKTRSAEELPGRMNAGLKGARPAVEPKSTVRKTGATNATAEGGKEAQSAGKPQQGKTANPSDELLFPNEDEQREINAHNKNSGRTVRPDEARAGNGPVSGSAPASTQARAAPVLSIESGVDPESWAEYGGWYQQDHAIFYRPTGHKDRFLYSWLFLTGPQAPTGDAGPAAAVFEVLRGKDAQGSCTKCHSVDDLKGKGRVVNFAPLSVAGKQESFTRFVHEPHFGVIGDRGCLTCHKLESGRPYLKSYEQSNPHTFASEFGAVKKDLCQTCHTSSMARQDCLTCHKYHVNDVITPITATKNPTQ